MIVIASRRNFISSSLFFCSYLSRVLASENTRCDSNLVKIDSFCGSRAEIETVYVPLAGLGNRWLSYRCYCYSLFMHCKIYEKYETCSPHFNSNLLSSIFFEKFRKIFHHSAQYDKFDL